jgi:hypothetical protein
VTVKGKPQGEPGILYDALSTGRGARATTSPC